MDKRVIILFGPPGAGKGTQSELLAEQMNLYLFETSKILEREFKRAQQMPDYPERTVTVDGEIFEVKNEQQIWEEGKLNSPPWVVYLTTRELERLANQGESVIMAGSPRTLYEAEKEMPLLERLYGKENIRIVLLEISPETTTFRNVNRKICELMRHSILFNKETESLTRCPLDGSKLIRREDLDNPETIKTRLEQYKERTLPLFNYFKEAGFHIEKINGEQSVSEVHADVLKAIS